MSALSFKRKGAGVNVLRFLAVISMVSFLTGSGLWAEEKAPAPPAKPSADAEAPLIKPTILKVGDRIQIVIYPSDEYITGGEMLVSSEGAITLSHIGKVEVAGLSIIDAERKLVEILAKDYLVNPEVVIELRAEDDATRPKLPVSVLGAVRKPGNYQIPIKGKAVTLIQAILEAGGFSEIANIKKIKVTRKETDRTHTLRVNAEDIINGSEPDLELQENDIIHVSESLF